MALGRRQLRAPVGGSAIITVAGDSPYFQVGDLVRYGAGGAPLKVTDRGVERVEVRRLTLWERFRFKLHDLRSWHAI